MDTLDACKTHCHAPGKPAVLRLARLRSGARQAQGQQLPQSHSCGALTHLIRHTAWRQRLDKQCCRAQASTELEEVDPRTGEIISGASVKGRIAGRSVQAGQFKWAYRQAEVDESNQDPSKHTVIMLHGLGSCSYAYRELGGMLGKKGWNVIAPDWLGHGNSDKPDPSKFDYSQQAYMRGLGAFLDAVNPGETFTLAVQGFVLSQYAMLWAAENPGKVERLLMFNTPLNHKTKLRPELAAYKSRLAFTRPDPKKKPFDGANFAAGGLAYALDYSIAQTYNAAYEESPVAASTAIAETMNQLDFPALLGEVDEAYRRWKAPTLLLFGQADPFVESKGVFEWLEDKRTNMKLARVDTRLGHAPQEDYPEAIMDLITAFLEGAKD